MTYKLIIIGAGAGGFGAMIKANELNIKTLVVNSGLPLGGTCVNVGCVPSKFLIFAGKKLYEARSHSIKGIKTKVEKLDFEKIIEQELLLVKALQKEKYINVLKSLKSVDFVKGKAKFVSEKEIEVNGKIFKGEKFIIAVGSTAFIPPIKGLKEAGYLTHITALKNKTLPKSIAILGAGPLGLEFSQIYSRSGSKVYVFEKNPIFLPQTEREIALKLKQILENEGIKIYTDSEVLSVLKEKNKKILEVKIKDKREKFKIEEILVATGKVPNTKDLNLKKAKVELSERFQVKVNEFLQTSNKNIYAVGDCIDKPLRLETTSAHEGTLAVTNIFLNTKKSINYSEVPFTIFTDPQVSGVGFSESKQLETLKRCACRSLDFSLLPRALIERRQGIIKMLIDPKTKVVTGIHILSPNAGDIIYSGALIIKNKMTIDEVIESLPVFPTYSEAIKLCALSFYKDIKKLSCCI